MDTNELIREELQAIEERDGVILPEAVVEFAKNPKTALHNRFEWDDSVAGHEYRLWQARQVVRAVVTVIKTEKKEITTNAFVHFSQDNNIERGYRSIARVVTDEELTRRMLESALRELKIFRKKYADLKELSQVFAVIDAI